MKIIILGLLILSGCATNGDNYKIVCDEYDQDGNKICHLEKVNPRDNWDRK